MTGSEVVPLRRPGDALAARLELIEQAQSTIDVQYYLWDSDAIGYLILDALLNAADRGVTVRVVVDDLRFGRRTRAVASLCRHPHFDVRLFNPFRSRANLVTEGIEFVRRFARLDQRMHNKLLVADGRAAIAGGRNLAGEHFGLDDTMNLVDFDVLLTGAEVARFTPVFETYWTTPLAVPGQALDPQASDADLASARRRVASRLRAHAGDLASLLADRPAWPQRRREMAIDLDPGAVTVVADSPGVARPTPGTQVIQALRTTALAAQHDLVVATPSSCRPTTTSPCTATSSGVGFASAC